MKYNTKYQVRRKPRARKAKNLGTIRKLAGQSKMTLAERLSQMPGRLGQLAKVVSGMQGLINSETKYIDTTFTSTAITNSGTNGATVNSIAEGDDINQRNGRWILNKSIQWKLRLLNNASSITTNVGWAIIMIKDNTALTANPWTDVFASADPSALIKKDVSDHFIILRRGVEIIQTQGITGLEIKGFMSLKGLHTKYSGTGASNYEKGQIFLTFVADQATNTPALNGSVRFEYHDN